MPRRKNMLRVKTPQDAQQVLRPLENPSKFFNTCDGRELRSLQDLSNAIGEMDPGAFGHHVNNGSNHFAEWVSSVFSDKKLAREMREIHNQRLSKALVDYRLTWLDVKANEQI